MPDIKQPIVIGDVVLRNRVFLAPMSGVSDLPYRSLAWRHGAGAVTCEMIASQPFVEGQDEARLRLKAVPGAPLIVQIAGRDAHWMAKAAMQLEDQGADIIDINMGCPAKKVTGGYSGSALMRDLDHALRLIEAVVAATTRPVTLKMRLGWDHDNLNAPQLASRAEAAGIRLVTVHGRTRNQFYEGVADWQAVSQVKAAVSIPVVINGDISSLDEVAAALEKSGADAVMIGRASTGRPWLAGVLAGMSGHPQSLAIGPLVASHYDAILSHYGLAKGVRHARKHLSAYLDHFAPDINEAERAVVMTSSEPKTVQEILARVLSRTFVEAQQEAA